MTSSRAPIRLLLGVMLASASPAIAETPDTTSGVVKSATDRFGQLQFGSYGRVAAATDAKGAAVSPNNVVAHGSRLEEPSYLELDFRYRLPFAGVSVQTVTTLALLSDLFHYNGRFDATLAVRNLYLEARDIFLPGLSLWAGSRMYRGDDIYLFDYWPLDNLNTLGVGVGYSPWRALELALHGGVNRLDDEFQFQQVPAPSPDGGAEDVTLLDRQRFVGSLKASYRWGGDDRLGIKTSLYAEAHAIGSGQLTQQQDPAKQVDLPADNGWVLGAQLGLYNFAERASHLNLFLRYARGLAAYGDLTTPWGLAVDRTVADAQRLVLALSGNYERRWFSLLVGGYAGWLEDADSNRYDWEDGWEATIALRPMIHLDRHFTQAFEASVQRRWPAGLEPRSATAQNPTVTKLSVIPMVVFDRGSYDRPQFRLVYTLSLLNQGARMQYNEIDPRASRKVQHYFGVQVEWWFNSSYR